MAQKSRHNPLGWGIILIVIGLVFLLQNMDFNIWKFIARLWPLTLIGWGAWKLYFGLQERKSESENPVNVK